MARVDLSRRPDAELRGALRRAGGVVVEAAFGPRGIPGAAGPTCGAASSSPRHRMRVSFPDPFAALHLLPRGPLRRPAPRDRPRSGQAVVDHGPVALPAGDFLDPARYLATFLSAVPDPTAVAADPEPGRGSWRWDRLLGAPGTGRTWRRVARVAEIAARGGG